MRLIVLLAIALFAGSRQLTAAAPAAEISVTSLEDSPAIDGRCTLREAIEAAGSNSAVDGCPAGSPTGQDTITFAVEGTIFLDKPLVLSGGLTIQGLGPARTILDGQGTIAPLQLVSIGDGPLILRGLTIQNGRAQSGAGLNGHSAACESEIVIEQSLFQNNQAERDGGAILAGCGSWTIKDSTFAANLAANGGGMAILTPPEGSGDTLVSISNSTFSANHEGAIFAQRWDSANSTVQIEVRNSTIKNEGRYNIELASENRQSQIEAVIADTILSNRAGPNCFRVHGLDVPPPHFTSQGYNLVDSDSCAFDKPGDRQVPELVLKYSLGRLADNGGPTPTQALLPGSPAIDAGSCSGGRITADQRGVPRPLGRACDIGAYEYMAAGLSYLPFIH